MANEEHLAWLKQGVSRLRILRSPAQHRQEFPDAGAGGVARTEVSTWKS
jgi:hypothetical protein